MSALVRITINTVPFSPNQSAEGSIQPQFCSAPNGPIRKGEKKFNQVIFWDAVE